MHSGLSLPRPAAKKRAFSRNSSGSDAKAAMEELGIVPLVQPIRGGTDGARLSFMGVPCPNLCTGGGKVHSRFEYACVESMESIVKLLIALATRG